MHNQIDFSSISDHFTSLLARLSATNSLEKLALVTAAFLIALLGVILLTPVAMRLAAIAGVMDYPHARRVHTKPTPRWGGLAMYTSFLLTVLLVTPMRHILFDQSMLNGKVMGILVGGLLMTTLGALDDKFNVPAKVKLFGQIFSAIVLVLPVFGVRMAVAFDADLPWWLGMALTVIWVVAVTNTINLIDGLDGLAAGISGLAAMTFVIISLGMKGAIGEAILAAALVGVCAGFLRYNFHPAKVFMGDAGSHFLGFTIAALSILQNWKVATGLAFAVPILILAVPIFDTAFAIIRRLRRGQPIFSPDKGHLHHRLLNLGLDQRSVVLTIYLLTAIGCLLALFLARYRLWG
ncbi:MAG: MraY family glycosyltransferase [Armatimonadota bacterium]